MDVRLVVSLAAFMATLMTQEPVSARQFTATCTHSLLCAMNAADAEADIPQGMTGHVGCTMSCTLDKQCKHFNYVPAAEKPCHLFYTDPITFISQPGCEHYRGLTTGACRFNITQDLRKVYCFICQD